ncbi:MAG TPA: hypothetical protein VF941_05990 [Clostridia bacterium]
MGEFEKNSVVELIPFSQDRREQGMASKRMHKDPREILIPLYLERGARGEFEKSLGFHPTHLSQNTLMNLN